MDSKLQKNERGVSPVIAVALLIGFTIGLVGLVAVGATDIVGDLGGEEGADVTFDEDVEATDLEISVVDVDEGVDVLEARYGGETLEISGDPQTGDMGTVEDAEPGETVNVVAVDENADTENFVGSYTMTDD